MKLSDKKWTEFYIGGKNGVFNISSSCSGIDKNKLKITEDNLYIPYITRSEISNGINQFISEKKDGKYSIDKQNAITIGLDTQALFFQPYVFYTGQNIQVMRHNCLNKHTALFLILLLKIQMKKFNWGGNGATLGRLAKTRIMLPIDDNSKPDWQFMEEYTKAIFNKKQQDYKTYVEKSLLKIGDNIKMSAGGGKWKEFVLGDIFNIKIGKSINGNKVDKLSGNVPYITRKEVNNGLDGFINYNSDYLYSNGSVITIGNETAAPFVQTGRFFTGTKVNIMKAKTKISKEVLFFISQSIKQQKNKYSYSITINSTRLKKQKILLPVNDKNEPNYLYMEQYIKNIMYKKYNKYLQVKKYKNASLSSNF